MLNVKKIDMTSFFRNGAKKNSFEILSTLAHYRILSLHKSQDLFHSLSYYLPEYQNRIEKSFFVQMGSLFKVI